MEHVVPVPYPKALRLFPQLRQSILSSFDNCALTTYFDFKYRHGWHHPWQARGEVFHRFASRALAYIAHYSDDGTIPVQEALEVLHEVLRQEDVDRYCSHCGSQRVRKGITKRGMRYCLMCRRQFPSRFITVPTSQIAELYWVVKKWAHDNVFDAHNLVDVEKKLTATIGYPNGEGGEVLRTLTGTLDALLIEGSHDEHAIVMDWKDMWRLPPETEVGFGGYFQQRMYAFLIWENYPTVEKVTLREFYVRFSKPREASLLRSLHYEEIKRELEGLVLKFDRTVEESLWNNPQPGHHCGYCAMPEKCTIFPKARGEGRITSPADAERAAAEYVVAEAIRKQLRNQLKAWVEMHGPVPIKDAKGNRVLGFQEYERTETPSPEQIDELQRQLGRSPSAAEVKSLYRRAKTTRLGQFVPPPGLMDDGDEEIIEALRRTVAEAEQQRSVA